MELTEKEIDNLFKLYETPSQMTELLYRQVIPEYDKCTKLNGWPKTSRTTGQYIMELFIKKDKEYFSKNKKNVLPGGTWMNYGFSNDDKMEDWIVNIDGLNVTY